MSFDARDLLKLLAAVIAGAIIGLERELADKPAGFRTNILICLGAALFTVISEEMARQTGGDPTRIAAQIVTGVGFLGAGAIIQFRGNVIGLTTAATIWVVASVGVAFGAGHYGLGATGTVLTSLVLFGLSFAEQRIADWRSILHLELELDPAADVRGAVETAATRYNVRIVGWLLEKSSAGLTGTATIVGPAPRLRDFELALLSNPNIRSFRKL